MNEATVNTEPTVDEAIEELRRMFPEETHGTIEATFFNEVGMRYRIGLKDTNRHWNGTTLSEAMNHAREWNRIHARRFFCSCGGALTADEYAEHLKRGHDSGE